MVNIRGILAQYIVQLPIWIVWLVGLVLALARWRRHPRVSLLVVVALGIFIVRALVAPVLSLVVVHGGLSARRMGLLFSGINILSTLVGALAWGLLLAAVFVSRDSARKDVAARQRDVAAPPEEEFET